MSVAALWSVALWSASPWVGCTSDKTTPIGPTDTSAPTDTTTGPRGSDEASVVVQSLLPGAVDPNPRTVVLGMFAASREGVLNLSQCVSGGFCAGSLPENPGDSVLVTELDPTLLEDLETRQVGAELLLGPWSASYNYDSDSRLGFYFGSENNVSMPSSPVGIAFEGDWGEYESADNIAVPEPMVVTSPPPSSNPEFVDSVPISLAWEPGGEGQVYLVVETDVEKRLFRLDDDGQHSLDLSPLNLPDNAVVDLTLGRWAVTDIDHRGNMLNVQIQSNQRIRGTWRRIGPRTQLDVYDECGDAQVAPGVLPGNYFGDTTDASDDLDPGTGGCTGFQANGADGVVPIDLGPEDLLTVNYQLLSDDASLYLLTDCNDVGTCLVGSDQVVTPGSVEQVVYLNGTGNSQRVYAILDSFDTVTDQFRLDIIIESLGGDVLLPTCVDAINQGPITSGTFQGSMSGNANLIEPACAAPASGGEGLMQVYLDPGESLDVTVTTPGADPKIYLMYNCAIGDSCFLVRDNATNTVEQLQYINGTGFGEFFYLVVDSDTSLSEYDLDLTIQ